MSVPKVGPTNMQGQVNCFYFLYFKNVVKLQLIGSFNKKALFQSLIHQKLFHILLRIQFRF